jgi:hypothetical protein
MQTLKYIFVNFDISFLKTFIELLQRQKRLSAWYDSFMFMKAKEMEDVLISRQKLPIHYCKKQPMTVVA